MRFGLRRPPARRRDDAGAGAGQGQAAGEDQRRPCMKAEADADHRQRARRRADAVSHKERSPSRGKRIAYTATAGTLTIRDNDGKPTASDLLHRLHADGATPGTPAGHLLLQWRAGLGDAVAAHGLVRADAGADRQPRISSGPRPTTSAPIPTRCSTRPTWSSSTRSAPAIRARSARQPAAISGASTRTSTPSPARSCATSPKRRWNCPKFLFGESYGTSRSGALAYRCRTAGMALNGVVLLSSILNYGVRQPGLDQIYLDYLPSYAATAWYHNRLAEPAGRPRDAFLAEVRAFASGPYAAALAKGQRSRDAGGATRSRADVPPNRPLGRLPPARQSARRPLPLPDGAAARPAPDVGRLDSRYTGIDADAAGERPEIRRLDTAISGAFIASFTTMLAARSATRPSCPTGCQRAQRRLDVGLEARAPGARQPQNNAQHRGRPRRRDAHQPLSEGALAERLLRHGDAVLRHRVRPLAHDARAGAAAQRRASAITVRPHGLSEPATRCTRCRPTSPASTTRRWARRGVRPRRPAERRAGERGRVPN